MLSVVMNYFIVWNVGQGQFTTALNPKNCHHFDVGGEINVMSQIKTLCFNKMTYIYLSHWDLDHIAFALEFQKKQFRSCAIPPQSDPKKRFAKKILKNLRICAIGSLENKNTKLIFNGSKSSKASSNDQSMVYQNHNILIPGDSTKAQEKIWSSKLHEVDYLILGHHGSRTSTSEVLLNQLSHLRGAIGSARKKKYNHPHSEVVQSLKRKKIPLLLTEDWGHIAIELPSDAIQKK